MGKFEEEQGGLFSYSEAPIRIAACKCTWMALTSVTYGGLIFSVMFLLFQIIPPLRLTLGSLTGEWGMLQLSLLLGSELGLLGIVAFMTMLVPTLIMTWITALVFQYLFGRRLFGRSKGLVQEGAQIAKDITWMAFKSMLREANIAAIVVLIVALVASSFNVKTQSAECEQFFSNDL
ncbi:unnamed protein product [Calypogeia fissa]